MHLSDGQIRRLIDEPSALGATEREHADACHTCRARRAELERDAEWAMTLLARSAGRAPSPGEVESALVRVHRRAGPGGRAAVAWWRRPQAAAGVAAAAVLAGLVVWGPVGSYASQLLTVFQPVRVAAVTVPSDLSAGLGRLGDYGDVTVPKGGLEAEATQAAAEGASGLSLSLPTVLPSGLKAPQFAVLPQSTVQFTFLASKAAETAARAGVTLPPMPPSLDHSTLSITVGPAAAAVYASAASAASGAPNDMNGLYVAVTAAPVVRSNGAGTATIENYLLSLPGIPASLATELRALESPSQTLPLPIPEGQATATNIRLGSQGAVAISDTSGLYNAVVWEASGDIHAVAGPFTAAEILAAARSVAAQG